MTKLISKISALVLLSAILVSCGSSRFSHSRYGNRSWVKVGSAQAEQEVPYEKSKEDKVVFSQSANEEVVKASIAEEKKAEVITESVIVNKEENSEVEINTTSNEVVTTDALVNETSNQESNPLAAESVQVSTSRDVTADADAMFVLMIILAFLIPPLAVYLKDGSVTGLFWLTLILCILGGGLFFGFAGYYGGLWLIAVVLALLRVLDMI